MAKKELTPEELEKQKRENERKEREARDKRERERQLKEKTLKNKERLKRMRRKEKSETKKIKRIINFPFKILNQSTFLFTLFFFIVIYFGVQVEIYKAVFYTFIFFSALYLSVGLVMVGVFMVMSEKKKKELEELIRKEEEARLAEEERIADEEARLEESLKDEFVKQQEEMYRLESPGTRTTSDFTQMDAPVTSDEIDNLGLGSVFGGDDESGLNLTAESIEEKIKEDMMLEEEMKRQNERFSSFAPTEDDDLKFEPLVEPDFSEM